MILVIDNYDSFTYNLVNMLDDPLIMTNDHVYFDPAVTGVVISPGPGHPLDSNVLMEAIEMYRHLPILGICLGAQALTCYYGGTVTIGRTVHGKVDELSVIGGRLYEQCPSSFRIMRYHSLVSDPATFPSELQVTGRTSDAIQSFEHKHRHHYGIQYHPESFASEYGEEIIEAFIHITKEQQHEDIKKTYSI